MKEMPKQDLENLINILNDALEARTLLDALWYEIDAYSGMPRQWCSDKKEQGRISQELLMKLRDFYEFDDSE